MQCTFGCWPILFVTRHCRRSLRSYCCASFPVNVRQFAFLCFSPPPILSVSLPSFENVQGNEPLCDPGSKLHIIITKWEHLSNAFVCTVLFLSFCSSILCAACTWWQKGNTSHTGSVLQSSTSWWRSSSVPEREASPPSCSQRNFNYPKLRSTEKKIKNLIFSQIDLFLFTAAAGNHLNY